MESEFEALWGEELLGLDAFLEAEFVDPFSSDHSEGSSSNHTEAEAQEAVHGSARKRPRGGSTSNSDDSGHSISPFAPAFPPELSEELLAKNIAAATERDLKALNIDPNSKEGKKQKRLIRNRMSAQLHRERKREHLKQLEQQLATRDEVIQTLQARITLLEHENAQLRAKVGANVTGSTRSDLQHRGSRAGVALFSVFAIVCCVTVWLDPTTQWAGSAVQVGGGGGGLVPFGASPSHAMVVRPHGRVLMATTPNEPTGPTALLGFDDQSSSSRQLTVYMTNTDEHVSSDSMSVVPSFNYYNSQHKHPHSIGRPREFYVDCDSSTSACRGVQPLWKYSSSLDFYPQWQGLLDAANSSERTSDEAKSRLRRRKTAATRDKHATDAAPHDIIVNFTFGEQPVEERSEDDMRVEIRCKVMQTRLLNNVGLKHLQ